MNKEFFKDKKIINAWQMTRDKSSHPLFQKMNQGDVAFVYNDPTSKTGRRISSFKTNWYFYLKKDEEALKLLRTGKTKYKVGENWIKVFVTNKEYKDPRVIKMIRTLEAKKIKTYEGDVSPMKRLCLDMDVKVEDFDKVRVLYFDIETDDTKKFIDIGAERILSFAAVDQDNREFYITDKDEKVLLQKVEELIRSYDMLVGWNSYKFDLPYLKARFKKHFIPGDYLYNILNEDMMKRVNYFYTRDPENRQAISSYSLESISQHFLKEGKKKYKGRVIDLFNKEPETLREYNINDCRLLKKLEDKLGTIRLTYQLFQTCQTFAQNWSMVKAIDNFLLSDANKKGVHYRTNLNYLKTVEENEEKEELPEYLGAMVLEPTIGYHEKVYDLDFKSLYPNIIRTFNISPETLLPEYYLIDGKTPQITIPSRVIDGKEYGKKLYLRDQLGIIPGKIGILLEDRKKIRDQQKGLDKNSEKYKDLNVKQIVVKELTNSIYGVLGNQYFREFNTDLSESITATGQYLILRVQEYLNKTGRKVIYGDTDSVFVIIKKGETIEDVLKEINTKLAQHLKKEFNVKQSTIEMALDTMFDKFIITSKKKYVGENKETTKYVGMECVKRDTIPIAVEYQKELIKRLFDKGTAKLMSTWIQARKLDVMKGKIGVEGITIRKKLTKNPENYKAKVEGKKYTSPIHVRVGAEKGMKGGEIVQYVVVDGGKGKINKAVHIEDFDGKFDRTYYWNQSVYPILERILKTIFPDHDWDQYYIDELKKPKQQKLL